jgi:hypothetical protein
MALLNGSIKAVAMDSWIRRMAIYLFTPQQSYSACNLRQEKIEWQQYQALPSGRIPTLFSGQPSRGAALTLIALFLPDF